MEMKQQEAQGEEIPKGLMSVLKISRKHCPQQHHPYDLPTWGQIKTLTNRAENFGLNRDCLRVLNTFSWQCSVFWPVPSSAQARLIPNPPLLQVVEWT